MAERVLVGARLRASYRYDTYDHHALDDLYALCTCRRHIYAPHWSPLLHRLAGFSSIVSLYYSFIVSLDSTPTFRHHMLPSLLSPQHYSMLSSLPVLGLRSSLNCSSAPDFSVIVSPLCFHGPPSLHSRYILDSPLDYASTGLCFVYILH